MNLALSPAVSDYVGVPFLNHGRTPAGWDCYGLVYYILRRHFHLGVPSYSLSYSDASEPGDAFDEHFCEWRRVEVAEAGDVVVLNMGGLPIHCGLVFEPGLMLHCMPGRETVLEHFDSLAWQRRVAGVYRWTSSSSPTC